MPIKANRPWSRDAPIYGSAWSRSRDLPEQNHERLGEGLKVVVAVYRGRVVECHLAEHLHTYQAAFTPNPTRLDLCGVNDARWAQIPLLRSGVDLLYDKLYESYKKFKNSHWVSSGSTTDQTNGVWALRCRCHAKYVALRKSFRTCRTVRDLCDNKWDTTPNVRNHKPRCGGAINQRVSAYRKLSAYDSHQIVCNLKISHHLLQFNFQLTRAITK